MQSGLVTLKRCLCSDFIGQCRRLWDVQIEEKVSILSVMSGFQFGDSALAEAAINGER